MTIAIGSFSQTRGRRSVGAYRLANAVFHNLLLYFPLTIFILVCSASAQTFEELKKRYLTLRNTDPEVSLVGQWEELASKFQRLVDRAPRDSDAPTALFNAALLYETVYNRFAGDDRLRKALSLLDRVAREYSGAALADDALVKRGDLLLFKLHDRRAARANFQEVVAAYPKSDLVLVAQARLRAIEAGSERQGSSATPVDSQEESKPGRPLILLDPGHGGEDFGAQGQGGLLEKDVTLDVALRLEKLLKEQLKAIVRMTRRGDQFVPLQARTDLANDFEAALFVSLHTNASPEGKLFGTETYYLDNTDDASSRKLAERENQSLQFEGQDENGAQADLSFMLSDLIQNAKLDDSILLANTVQHSLVHNLPAKWGKRHDLGVKRAPFFVLVGAHMPCILVEMAFIDHQNEGKLLANSSFRQDLAQAMLVGIREFLARAPRGENG